jgi:hypothetical protein
MDVLFVLGIMALIILYLVINMPAIIYYALTGKKRRSIALALLGTVFYLLGFIMGNFVTIAIIGSLIIVAIWATLIIKE